MGGVFHDLHACEAGEPQARVRGVQQVSDLVLRHSFGHCMKHGFVGFERDLAGQAHQLDLVAVFDHAAPRGDRRCADDLERRRRAGDALAEDELRRLLDADASRREATILEALGNALERTLVLLPRPHVGRFQRTERQLFARALFFKRRAHAERVALRRQHDREEPFAVAPADACEIGERGPAGEDHCVEGALGHQAPGALNARAALIGGDRRRLIAHRRERADARRQRTIVGAGAAAALSRHARDRQPRTSDGRQPEKRSAGKHSDLLCEIADCRLQILDWF